MKRFLIVSIAVFAALFVSLPAAQAQQARATLGGGSGIVVGGDFLCTLTTIGYDNGGRLVGFTAGHCGGPGAPVTAEATPGAGVVGNIARTNGVLDYAVIVFDPARVNPVRTVGPTTITGTGGPAHFPELVCKQGRSTGHTCGISVFVDPVYNETWGLVCVSEGDSGGPVTRGTQLIGLVSAYFLVPCVGPKISINMEAVLADAFVAGGPGAGFRPI
ncbi:chymotrypsin family serine protease [Hoyosella subflava]